MAVRQLLKCAVIQAYIQSRIALNSSLIYEQYCLSCHACQIQSVIAFPSMWSFNFGGSSMGGGSHFQFLKAYILMLVSV